MRLTPAQQEACVTLLRYAYAMAGKLGPRNTIDRRSVAHFALIGAVASHGSKGESLPLREHVRRSVRDALRAAKLKEARRERRFAFLTPEEWDERETAGIPPGFVGAESQEWVDHVLGQLDPADEAIAHRVFVNGEPIRSVAGEIDSSNAYRVRMQRKVIAIRTRIAEIIAEEGGHCSCN
jgi:hypothetical protein